MALTATATSQVQRDILSVLRIPQARVFKTSFERANLTFRVVPKLAGMAEDGEEPLALLRLRLYCASKGAGAAGIVYCLSRDESEQVAAHLRDWGNLAAAHYHAGMTHKQRMQVGGGLWGWLPATCHHTCSAALFVSGVLMAMPWWQRSAW
jgi:bloom syndrome protein